MVPLGTKPGALSQQADSRIPIRQAADMSNNIEIKARLSRKQALRLQAEALSHSSLPPEILHQTDTFFNAPSGRLKLREIKHGCAELIAYDRPDHAGPKLSSYVCCPCSDPRSLHEALTRSLGVRGVVEKHRQVIHIGQTRVHLDEVFGLGDFLEFEVVLRENQSPEEGKAIALELMATFGIEAKDLIEVAYIDLLEAQTFA
jgi:predicted adenylyl cyclase CyaB